MNFPQSVPRISLLCGTNKLASTSLAVISATIIEILSVIAKKCPTPFIQVFSILPRFDHCYSFVQVINSRTFSGLRMLSERVLFDDLPPSLCNKNMYRDEKIHLTNKGNDILVRRIHYCNPEPRLEPPPFLLPPATFLQLLTTGLSCHHQALNPLLFRQAGP